ncbi:Coadhesin [Orchesella cincta]|uniref:Coadhesin n=1 Tax=Orchesella cincta TaxID=48709 RepID=A0A1D2MXB4_ORCCI|nr:Coadhesin [Orchesella cincta]
MFHQLKPRTFMMFLIVSILNIDLCQSKPFNLDSLSLDAKDMDVRERELRVKRNTSDLSTISSPSRSNEEILAMVMIGVGILLFFVCCGVCCKHCWCPRKSSRGMVYQQMATNQRLPNASTNTSLAGVHNMVPLRHQHHGFTEMHSQTSPPPPYSGLSVRNN